MTDIEVWKTFLERYQIQMRATESPTCKLFELAGQGVNNSSNEISFLMFDNEGVFRGLLT